MVNLSFRNMKYAIYEIYPENETPRLTQIAHLDRIELDPNPHFFKLLPGIVIWYRFHNDRIVFEVWDYLLNHSIKIFVDVDANKFGFEFEVYSFFSKVLKMASNSLVDNGDEYSCHRLMRRSGINLGHSSSIASSARYFRPQSHPYATTTLHDSIPGDFSPSCTSILESNQWLVFWPFATYIFRHVMSRFQTSQIRNHA